ncbi:MAG: DUF2807 domain-containing protein [Dyadobacter sp. 50-39]|uniref:head GIN domain-containing protein n=1 Tax=Dyadobacter sp. 50-39 TaxID=1895756 RepID=UPI0009662620|nr:head GIN domain-containing protein [Dyadobacter sp. 50-39]OJV21196.1 MAG: DUF2807 domain-containing protein [Dyadobacter sp. 50-39]|eukprot:Unigene15680_Nuclearia_a/m.46744 Unigene15680_Nuclearia_a/g.46744  ORF Unigene15680_Nuclearia_a/g.46744 Unigene15680_Nuclearia_a/m.46744 type:complete len:232 (+) Unigene15680_Nuclearia_a:37-732(+)
MKRTQLFLFAALLITAFSCSVSAQETRKFNASGFTKLSMGSAFKIDVKQGGSFSITATGRAEDLNDLESAVKGGTFHLGYKNHGWNKNRKTVEVSLTMPALDGVDFSGASKANVARFSGVRSMEIEVSGASQVTMSLAAPKVSVDLSGASSLTLTGEGDVLTGDVSGASSLKGRDFSAKTVNIDALGASSAAVLASNTVNAEASGASSIRYSGGARDIHSSTSGASSVKRD